MSVNENTMPPEILELSRAERILSHLQDGYDLPEEDKAYFDLVNLAFKMIHGEEDRDVVPKKLKTLFPEMKGKQIEQLINDVTFVYDDFFTVNRMAMRMIQEKRHERVYEAALANGEYAAAERALQSIDKIHHLDSNKDVLPNTSRRMPKVMRTSDPEALKKLAKSG